MSPAIRALLMSFIAGMSTVLGAVVVFALKKKSEKMLAISLGFAAGVMLSVSFCDLLPNATLELFRDVGQKMDVLCTVLFMAAGLILAALLDHFVPHEDFDTKQGERPHKDLFRVGFISTLAIAIHNFPEGIATFMAGYDNAALGVSITLAIAMHNIPEGISIAMPMYFATDSKRKAFRYTLLSGIAEPIGALIAFFILRPFLGPFLLGSILAIVAGIMIYIALEELLPSSRQYGNNQAALIALLVGICIMPLTGLF